MTCRTLAVMVTLLLGIAAAPLIAEGQRPGTMPRIGYLVVSPLADPPSAERAAFLAGLRDLGYVEGRNIAVEYRSAAWNRELLPDLAAELVAQKVDVIVAVAGTIDAARDATKTIPIVMPGVGDPMELGYVANLGRPGGNITGTAWSTAEVGSKQVQFVKEALPKASRVALLWNPTGQDNARTRQDMLAAARALGMTFESLDVRDPKDFPNAFSAMARKPPHALITILSPLTSAYRPIIVEFATKHRIPTMFGVREDVAAGGLMSYAPNSADQFRRAAGYVDKILKGAKPGELPIEQPREFEVVVNLKTAKALGLTLPPSLLLRATEVLQ